MFANRQAGSSLTEPNIFTLAMPRLPLERLSSFERASSQAAMNRNGLTDTEDGFASSKQPPDLKLDRDSSSRRFDTHLSDASIERVQDYHHWLSQSQGQKMYGLQLDQAQRLPLSKHDASMDGSVPIQIRRQGPLDSEWLTQTSPWSPGTEFSGIFDDGPHPIARQSNGRDWSKPQDGDYDSHYRGRQPWGTRPAETAPNGHSAEPTQVSSYNGQRGRQLGLRPPSSGLLTPSEYRDSPGIDYSVFVADLAPNITEQDLVSHFLDPPPWPAGHPLAIAQLQSRQVARPSSPPRPAPFVSTKTAKIVCDPVTGASRGYGFVRFHDETECGRALTDMQGLVITPYGASSKSGRPLRVFLATSKSRSTTPATTPSASATFPSVASPSTSPGETFSSGGTGSSHQAESRPKESQLNPNASSYFARGAFMPSPSVPTLGRYHSPSPAEIAQLSHAAPQAKDGRPATLPGFPMIPATGASGPVDVGLRLDAANSSYGGAASLAGTGFTLGPSTLPSPSSALDPNNTTVFVGGLSSLISEETLKTFFTPFGSIAYVKIPPGKGCGFVSFVRKIDAERAIERMQGFPIGGCRIRLSWGRSQGEKNQHLAQQQMANLNQVASLAGMSGLGGLAGLSAEQIAQLVNLRHVLGHNQSSGTYGKGDSYAASGVASGRGHNPAAAYSTSSGSPPDATQDFLSQFGSYGPHHTEWERQHVAHSPSSAPLTRSFERLDPAAASYVPSTNGVHASQAWPISTSAHRGISARTDYEEDVGAMFDKLSMGSGPYSSGYSGSAEGDRQAPFASSLNSQQHYYVSPPSNTGSWGRFPAFRPRESSEHSSSTVSRTSANGRQGGASESYSRHHKHDSLGDFDPTTAASQEEDSWTNIIQNPSLDETARARSHSGEPQGQAFGSPTFSPFSHKMVAREHSSDGHCSTTPQPHRGEAASTAAAA